VRVRVELAGHPMEAHPVALRGQIWESGDAGGGSASNHEPEAVVVESGKPFRLPDKGPPEFTLNTVGGNVSANATSFMHDLQNRQILRSKQQVPCGSIFFGLRY